MKTVGIIAEYNPFHNGHLYQLNKAREITGADYCIVVMSGDFTQRGTPAVFDKYIRCRMALLAGADLVIELPVVYATASAETFAMGAVSLLNALGVDALCFGSECGDLTPLQEAADILLSEPPAYKSRLSSLLKSGLSYPAARAAALSGCLNVTQEVLASPNNILGIEYLKALSGLTLKGKQVMTPFTIKREGEGYLSRTLQKGSFCSAMALRERMLHGEYDLKEYIPEECFPLFSETCEKKIALCADDFSPILLEKLLSSHTEGYTAYLDVSKDLSDKIRNTLFSFTSFSDYCENILKTKDLTLTRLYRTMLHILLSIQDTQIPLFSPYARLLGFRESASPVLNLLSAGEIPVIARKKDADSLNKEEAKQCLSKDLYAAHLYESVRMQKDGCPMIHEFSRPVIRI